MMVKDFTGVLDFMRTVFILWLENLMYLLEITFFCTVCLLDVEVVLGCCFLCLTPFVCHYVSYPQLRVCFLRMCQAQLSDRSDNMQSEY